MIKSIKKISISLSIFTIFVFMLFFMTACNSIKNPASYSIDNNGDLIAIYDDGTIENLGNFNNQIAESIISIDISNDGYYVINGLKTNISATKVYKVEFSTGFSTTVPAQNVKDGYKAIRPEITRNGYTLIGWYCNGEEWLFNSNIVKNDIMLEAKWEANEYTITFDSNGGNLIDSIKIKTGEKMELPTPIKNLYTFEGWYVNDKKVEDIDFQFAADIKLTAMWSRTQYTITFDVNGGEYIPPMNVNSYSQISELPIPTKLEHKFLGWYIEENKITLPYDFTEGNVTLTAKWQGLTKDYEFTQDDVGTGVKITKYIGNDSDIVVPCTLGGSIVTTISTNAFNSTNIKSISFTSNVQNFEYKCFQNCNSLQEINIAGNTVATLIYMFGGENLIPNSLKEINFVDGTETYGKNIFKNLSSEKTFIVHIYSTLTTTPEDAFYECNNIKELYFPEGITTISNRTVCAMSNLQYVNIPNTVTSIGMNTFINLPKLKYLIVPQSVTYVDYAGLAATDSILLIEAKSKPNGWSESAFSIYENEMSIFYGFEGIKENENFKYALCSIGSVKYCIILENKTSVSLPELIDGYVVVAL